VTCNYQIWQEGGSVHCIYESPVPPPPCIQVDMCFADGIDHRSQTRDNNM
jgi:hypothetical protein